MLSGHRAYKRGLNSKLHLAVDSLGMPVRKELSKEAVADCTQAHALIAEILAEYLLADRGYDTDSIAAEAEAWGIQRAIPPRSHRKEPIHCDQVLYKLRHLLENAFLFFKRCRAAATRYAKNKASFLVICQVRAHASGTT